MSIKPCFKRVLIKLSGEALCGEQGFGFSAAATAKIAEAIQKAHAAAIEIAIVVGGGNIFRGSLAEEFNFKRTPADHIGMLSTTINGLALEQALANLGCKTHIMSAFNCAPIIENYNWHKAMDLLKDGVILIFVGGTGNPYFTTDSAAALKACEIEADILLKATKVDGVYSDDPKKNPNAVKSDRLTYNEILSGQLGVMDATAVALCRDNNLPIYVFNIFTTGSLNSAIFEKSGGTLISGD